MNETNRFFIIINRINSVLLLVAVLLATGAIITAMFTTSQWQKNRTIEVQDNAGQRGSEKVKLRLGYIEQISGTSLQFVRLETEPEGVKLSSGGYPTVTRNVMFLTKKLKQARWLFPQNHYCIKTIAQLQEKEDYEKNNATRAMYYEVIKADSNGDGKLGEDDDAVVALSRVDGSGYVEVASNLHRIIGHKTINQGTEVAVLGEKDGKVLYITYSLRNFSKTSETIIAEIAGKL
jgi:hypothetical protein